MAISYKEAKEIALSSAKTVVKSEIIDISNALNRVIARDIDAARDLPPYNNSAMDGFAFRHSDIKNNLKIVATVYAGDIQEAILNQNECYRIMTGAKVPSDADTIVPIEFCKVNKEFVKIQNDIKKGNALRLKGEELKVGQSIIKRGEILTYDKIALLASQGVTKVEVYKKLKIAIVASGNEIKEPWEKANSDEVYNINSINIKMLLESYGFYSDYKGKLADNLEDIVNFVATLKEYDVIITTGGISAGDADFTKEAFIKNGLKELFHGVRIKPGHPTMFGVMDKTFIMAMPGNPLAAILNFILLGIETLYKLQGSNSFEFKRCRVKMAKDLKLKSGRVNIVLGKIKNRYFIPYNDNKYGSGMIVPLVNSSVIAIFEEDISLVKQDSEIEVVLL